MTRNLDTLKTYLHDYAGKDLQPDPRERGKYSCPFCGSGVEAGPNHDGGFSFNPDGIHWKCFSCNRSGDIFDYELWKEGVDPSRASKEERSAATRAVMAYYDFSAGPGPVHVATPAAAAPAAPAAQADAPVRSFAGQIAAWHAALKGSDGEKYLRQRGITDETMDRCNLGFATDLHGQPAVVFPYNRQNTYYSMRTILQNVDKTRKHTKPKVEEAGPEPIFNADALRQPVPCFVVESQLCAISILQEGGSAIAIGGIGGINKLKALKAAPVSPLLILSLDNDEKGQKAQADLAEALREKDIPFAEFNVAGTCKDPNELLQENPAALHACIEQALEIAQKILGEAAERERIAYEGRTTAASFDTFESFLAKNADRPPIPTGFITLDNVLNGGLTAGLYIMGAISSLGKTSWMLNIADNIASAGRDVLYFSLEMSRNELIAKSISRLSFIEVSKAKGCVDDAFSTFGVLNSSGNRFLTFTQNAILDKVFKAYREGPGQHMWIFEGVGEFGVSDVAHVVNEHIRITGRTPVVFIDYLQILAPEEERATDKQNTDKAVVELKRLSAKQDLPIFCISSLNRQNYAEPITMAAFKESGAIEYGSDVLIGIQLYGVGYQPGEKQTAHAARIREILEKAEKNPQIDIEVRVLKNRNGGRGGSGCLRFDKKYNFFSEVPDGFTFSDTPTPFDEEDEEEGFSI